MGDNTLRILSPYTEHQGNTMLQSQANGRGETGIAKLYLSHFVYPDTRGMTDDGIAKIEVGLIKSLL